jgi:hypothetical protein
MISSSREILGILGEKNELFIKQNPDKIKP